MTNSPHALPAPTRLRAALIGLGRIGFQFHAPALHANSHFAFTAALDPLPERRREAEDAWGVKTYADLGALLAAERPEVVVIASPTPWHAEQARLAFAAGAHVVCDKPVAQSVAEFDTMAAAATHAARKLMAYQPHRLGTRVRTLREILASGRLGEIHLVRAARSDYRRRNDWQATLAHGGGMLNNYASHALDEIVACFGAEPVRSVHCETRRVASLGDAEDVVKALIVTEGGRIIDLDISQAGALEGAPWLLQGSRGAAAWDEKNSAWEIRWFDPAEAPPVTLQQGQAAAGRSYNPEQLPWRSARLAIPELPPFSYYDAVHAHLTAGAPSPVTVEETRHVLAVIEACRASAARAQA
jgi:predicted dehydrogenase